MLSFHSFFNIRPWCHPQSPQAQVESLLYVAVALATTAKIYHTKRETLQTAKELFTVPLMYDPRFQVDLHTLTLSRQAI